MLVQDNLDKIKLLLISGGEGNGHAGLYSQNIVGWWRIKPDVCTRDTPALIRPKDTASDNQSPLRGISCLSLCLYGACGNWKSAAV